ncbi:ThiF family adenylyltransferase [Solimonas sp. SE-A11]|uniref:HesA/MoeB/ThiF family protein n=1 Tax=Solimonas sp. SE-A11 TaxID=3054954 RepID=UPI00259CA270|nr:ThiF family adenylyltransferase [Solimonas sp. SE-A11]MDM4772861.1 ThiF family adenylyltransferase [Solimonas sp. SE-A11]
MKTRFKMLGSHWRQLAGLLGDTSTEQACFLLTSSAVGVDETILTVRDIIPLTEDDFAVKEYDLLSVAAPAMLRAFRKAQRTGCGICMVHTHPMAAAEVCFSVADDIGNRATFDYFCKMLPDRVHSCLVWNASLSAVQGRVYTDGLTWQLISQVEVIDDHVRRVLTDRARPRTGAAGEAYKRQVLLLGAQGQQLLHGLRVVVVGAGGLGSMVAMTLGHSGVGWLGLVDPDILDVHNRPRQVGSRDEDIGIASKVAVMARYLATAAPDTRVQTWATQVQAEDLRSALVSADLVVCTTDSDSSRAHLNEICQRHLIPLLDLGVEFDADPTDGHIRGDIGKINLMLPGTPCLLCTGHLNPMKIAWESLPQTTRENQVRDGYVRNWHLPQPSMMPFNGSVAARGVQLLLGYITGLIPATPDAYERYTFLNGNGLRHHSMVRKRGEPDCIICSPSQGLVGHGATDPTPMAAKLLAT